MEIVFDVLICFEGEVNLGIGWFVWIGVDIVGMLFLELFINIIKKKNIDLVKNLVEKNLKFEKL